MEQDAGAVGKAVISGIRIEFKDAAADIRENFLKQLPVRSPLMQGVAFWQLTIDQGALDFLTCADCDFVDCTFSSVSICGATFKACNFSGCHFDDVVMTSCTFIRCVFSGTSFTRSNLAGAYFGFTVFDGQVDFNTNLEVARYDKASTLPVELRERMLFDENIWNALESEA